MRYIGGKENLLNFIDSVINEKVDRAETFADIFAGTAVVAKHFKKKNYAIISNDILYFSYLIQRTYIQNNSAPSFHKTGKNIYEIYDEDEDDQVILKDRTKDRLVDAIHLIIKGSVLEAKEIFVQIKQENPHDGVVDVYLRRCEDFSKGSSDYDFLDPVV